MILVTVSLLWQLRFWFAAVFAGVINNKGQWLWVQDGGVIPSDHLERGRHFDPSIFSAFELFCIVARLDRLAFFATWRSVLRVSLRQPRPVSLSLIHLFMQTSLYGHVVFLCWFSIASSITLSLVHFRLKTYMFHKSFPLSSSTTQEQNSLS